MAIDTTTPISAVKYTPKGGSQITIPLASSGGTIIRTAELPDVSITLSQNGTDIETKTTPATTGGIVDFNVDTIGTYTITASGTNITTWTKTIEVTELNTIVECKGQVLANYTKEQIHTALQGGYFSTMFSYGDKWRFTQTGSLFNNLDFFVEKITKSNGKEIVDFRAVAGANSTYNIFPQMSYITSSSASSWIKTRYSYGGYKYSAMRQRMMKQGEDVYSQATGILPDDYSGSLTTGVKFSDLKYSDTGLTCPIYLYSSSADTMTQLNAPLTAAPSNTAMMFIKGYFKSVGAIAETTFNNGVYYVYDSTNYVYTKAASYVSGTTYYGLYETMQEDGIFVNALSSLSDYLVRFNDYASAGGTQTSKVSSFSDYVDIPALEEITGLNRTMTTFSGSSATNMGVYNLAGEGTKKPAYTAFDRQAINYDYWTRSTYSGNSNGFCYITSIGYITSYNVYIGLIARIGFRLS